MWIELRGTYAGGDSKYPMELVECAQAGPNATVIKNNNKEKLLASICNPSFHVLRCHNRPFIANQAKKHTFLGALGIQTDTSEKRDSSLIKCYG